MNPGFGQSNRSTKTSAIAVLLLGVLLGGPMHARSQPSRAKAPFAETALALRSLVIAFNQDYYALLSENEDRSLCEGMAVYYLRRELQALVDMWRATGDAAYLKYAKNLTLQAIDEAKANPQTLIWHDEPRGDWPCFYLATVADSTGGHSQLCDFQGSVGLLMVARALYEIDDPAADEIVAFVEGEVVEKWLYYKPSRTPDQFQGADSFNNVLAALNTGRDTREHFTSLCLDLNEFGSCSYAYYTWAQRLIEIYLTIRYDSDEPAPNSDGIENLISDDWGLLAQEAEAGVTWLLVPNYDTDSNSLANDTSHANRTAWLAARACSEGLVDKAVVAGLVNTLKFRIWAREKGPFYFNNYVDGSDEAVGELTSGRAGNVWFGWHRLAAYDAELETLFVALAADLATGGDNLPTGAQNKAMANAPLCLQAWGARLLATSGQPDVFP